MAVLLDLAWGCLLAFPRALPLVKLLERPWGVRLVPLLDCGLDLRLGCLLAMLWELPWVGLWAHLSGFRWD